ncbi:MAG TPA: insulinase family protein, partial [Candidatus Elarobacter sp.]|nr:insulinase family protein [Candidatus Elarobacter sp.]
TPSELIHVPFDRVRTFAERAFRPSNAILVLTGNVSTALLAGAANRPASGAPETAEPPAPQALAPTPGPLQRVSGLAGTGLGWAGPPIADEADATALDFLADVLFAPGSGSVSRALAASKADVTGRFVTYHDPGLFLVTISGDGAGAARPVVDREIARATAPMAPAAFEAARAAFVYRLLSDMGTPADLADTFGWYAVEGDAGYAPAEGGTGGRYFGLVARLTPAAVAGVAAKYLGRPPVVVTVTEPPSGART